MASSWFDITESCVDKIFFHEDDAHKPGYTQDVRALQALADKHMNVTDAVIIMRTYGVGCSGNTGLLCAVLIAGL